MIPLTADKAAVVAALTDPSRPIYTAIPETLETPCVIVVEGDPWATPVEPFCDEFTTHWEALYVGRPQADNETTTAALTADVEQLAATITDHPALTLDRLGGFFALTHSGTEHLAARLAITHERNTYV